MNSSGVLAGLAVLASACGYGPLSATCPGGNCSDAGSNGDQFCTKSAECAPGQPVCDTAKNGGTCVQCTAASNACIGETPVCDTSADECRACSTDDDCADGGVKGVCLPSGGCVAQSNILHVTSTAASTAGDCGTANQPCKLDTALSLISATKNVIQIDEDGTYDGNGFTIGQDVTIDGRGVTTGAVFTRTSNGPIFTLTGGRAVTWLGGDLQGAKGGGGDAISCTDSSVTLYKTTIETSNESAIDATRCNVFLTKTIIRGNSPGSTGNAALKINDGSISMSQSLVTGNRGGGLNISGSTKFAIVGNLLATNGDPTSILGGVLISTTATGNRFEFNTVTQNLSQGGVCPGVNCTADVGFIAANNIIWKNNPLDSNASQTSGGCAHQYSAIGPKPVTGTGNIGDPKLVSDTDAHPQSTSPARNAANPSADLTGIAARDLDDKPRVAGGAAMAADMGAYVAPMP